MSQPIENFFSQSSENAPKGNFHKVLRLHELPEMTWEEAQKQVPTLPKGWFELSRLDLRDRIDFTREFWSSKLPYHPKLEAFLELFFGSLDSIGIFATQQKYDDPFFPLFVYCLKEEKGFFCGRAPADEDAIATVQVTLDDFVFPQDYVAFLEIHNGFRKATDSTGITPTEQLITNYHQFQAFIEETGAVPTTGEGKPIDPKMLLPFYESFGMPFFQCFWGEWYPENEMGNVYYSGMDHTISDLEDIVPGTQSMAFASFSDWLVFYLEQIE